MGLPRPAWAAPAAQTAVDAAKQYAGTEISIVWEAGLQALDPLNFSGPKWKELTGIDVKVIEVADRRDVHQDPAGAPRRHRRLRRAQRDPGLDARPGPRRCRGSRPLCRQVRLPRGAAGDRAGLPRQPDDGGRQDLRLPGRRRRLRHVLPHGRAGRPRRSRRPTRPSTAPICRCRPRPGRSSTKSAR